MLSRHGEDQINKISSDRVPVGNHTGWLRDIWNLYRLKWKWAENLINPTFWFCLASANQHIKFHSLRFNDGKNASQLRNRSETVVGEMAGKFSRTQELYRKNRRRRVDYEHRAATTFKFSIHVLRRGWFVKFYRFSIKLKLLCTDVMFIFPGY